MILFFLLLFLYGTADAGEWLSCPVKEEARDKARFFSPQLPARVTQFSGNVTTDERGIPSTYYILINESITDPKPCSRRTRTEVSAAVGSKMQLSEAEKLPPPRSIIRESLWRGWKLLGPSLAYATTITDAFPQGDEDPLSSGGAWSAYAALNALEVVSNRVRCNALNGTDCYMTRNDFTPANNQYASIAVPTVTSDVTANYVGVLLRFTAPETRQGYQFVMNERGGESLILHVDGDAYTTIASNSTAWAATDIIQGRADGTTLSLFRNGSLNLTASDASYSSGRCGIEVYINALNSLTNIEADNFVCGDLSDLTASGVPMRRPTIY